MINIALIPMRGGSKSIPLKNIKTIAGKPLCYWSILQALDSKALTYVYISTDCPEIMSVVEELFPGDLNKKLFIEKRLKTLAEDTTPTEEVLNEFIKNRDFNNIALIQVTSPLIESRYIDEGFEKLERKNVQSVVSVAPFRRFLWSEDGEPLNYDIFKRPRRQDFEGTYVENGAFYITTKDALVSSKNRISGSIGLIKMPEATFFEVDEPDDFPVIENLLLKKQASPAIPKAVIIDVDGTLTDGGMYYGKNGEELKKFNTQDAQGIVLIRKNNVKVFILTAEDSPSVHSRFKKIQVDEYQYGIKEKWPVLRQWLKENEIKKDEALYIGDDMGDEEAMSQCLHRACPQNAVPDIKKISNYISPFNGGDGAVRDILSYYFSI